MMPEQSIKLINSTGKSALKKMGSVKSKKDSKQINGNEHLRMLSPNNI